MATSVAPPAPVTEPVRQARAPYSLVATFGLLLVAAGPAVMLTAGLIAGMPLGEDGLFFGTLIVVPLVAAALAWRFGTWAKVVGILASAVAGFALFWTVFGLGHPGSFADFVPGVLVPLGVVLAVGGGIAAIVAGRRGRLAGTGSTERRIAAVAMAIVALAVVGSAITMTLSRSTVAAEGAMTVEIADFTFDQEQYAVSAGEATTLRIHNSDAFVHTFTIPELGIDETVLPGNSALVEVEAEAGEYTIYCAPHSDMSEADPAEAGMAAMLLAS